MLEQHGSPRSTRSSRLARLARQSRTCRVESSQVEFGLMQCDWQCRQHDMNISRHANFINVCSGPPVLYTWRRLERLRRKKTYMYGTVQWYGTMPTESCISLSKGKQSKQIWKKRRRPKPLATMYRSTLLYIGLRVHSQPTNQTRI